MTEEKSIKTVNIEELIEKASSKAIEKYANSQTPAENSQVLHEGVNPTPPAEDVLTTYKSEMIKLMKSENVGDNFSWTTPINDKERDIQQKRFEAIGALSAGSAIPEIWAKDVFRCCPYPASAFLGAPYIKWHEDIHGKPGDTVHVITVGKAICGTAGCAEPASTAATISATAITLEEYQCSHYVCRNDLEDMVEDTLVELNETLAECLDVCIDNAFIANITGQGSTLSKGTAHITPSDIAEAIGTMRSGTCQPVVLIIHPAVEARLMMNANFVNAATFGDRSVITGGKITQYLGLDIVTIPLGGSLAIDAPGTYSSLMLSKYAVHAAMKRDPSMQSQYLLQTQRKYFYASVRFGKSVVCNDGVLWIRTGA